MKAHGFWILRSGGAGWLRRAALPVVGLLAAVGVAACEPAPPPDGRDLGVVLDGAAPTQVEKGGQVELTGVLTNHGTAPASGTTVDYAVTGGFTVDDLDFGRAAACGPVSASHVSCALAEPLGAGESLPFTLAATAGEAAGSFTHVLGAGSAGSEPDPDANSGLVVFTVEVPPTAPVPIAIGNGTNHLGTGALLGNVPGRKAEDLMLSANPYCTPQVQGDRYLSGYLGSTQLGSCSGLPNPEFRPTGYHYDLLLPLDRPSAVQVLLWDARYNRDSVVGAGGTEEPGIDAYIASAASESFTYSLWGENSPSTDADDVRICTRTFTASTGFELSYLGSSRWNVLCEIPASWSGDHYEVRVTNAGAPAAGADGSNQFGIVARYANSAGGDGLCTRSTDALCPVVVGDGTASVYASTPQRLVDLALGTVPAQHAGRVLQIELFDPGEGGTSIELLAPTGTGTWARVRFEASWPGGSLAPATQLNVERARFDGKVVTLRTDLTGYDPPPDNQQWKVRYSFNDPTRPVVTDRTTWDVAVVDH